MCVAVALPDQYLQTLDDLIEAGLPVAPEDLAPWGRDVCLCCVDVERILYAAGLEWDWDDVGDYVVESVPRPGVWTPEEVDAIHDGVKVLKARLGLSE